MFALMCPDADATVTTFRQLTTLIRRVDIPMLRDLLLMFDWEE